MNTTRRSFLAFLGATVAAPALAKVPSPRLGIIGEIGPEVVKAQSFSRAILTWSPNADAAYYEVLRGGQLITTVSNSVSQVVFSSIIPRGEQETFFVRAVSPEGSPDERQPVYTRFVEDYDWPPIDTIKAT